MSDVSKTTSTPIWLLLTQIIFFYPFIYNQFVSLDLNCVSYRQHTIESHDFSHSTNLSVLWLENLIYLYLNNYQYRGIILQLILYLSYRFLSLMFCITALCLVIFFFFLAMICLNPFLIFFCVYPVVMCFKCSASKE